MPISTVSSESAFSIGGMNHTSSINGARDDVSLLEQVEKRCDVILLSGFKFDTI
ncbi:hypothetical protein M569_09996 [Genlisea aurea]|uniref:Uncharacterized protein n=1 Tax=Genlisea aurea TaxID=192259 RepID=S8CCU0_9LAMI|nr:hypothetical protein M569_09996 [Genlisea aurea]